MVDNYMHVCQPSGYDASRAVIKRKSEQVEWLDQPEAHDYAAAKSYLTLLIEPHDVGVIVGDLMVTQEIQKWAAKDILRASGLELLGFRDPHVAKDLEKIGQGEKLSPILLVRGQPLLVADGYHRVCASYHTDENTWVPAKIVSRRAA